MLYFQVWSCRLTVVASLQAKKRRPFEAQGQQEGRTPKNGAGTLWQGSEYCIDLAARISGRSSFLGRSSFKVCGGLNERSLDTARRTRLHADSMIRVVRHSWWSSAIAT